VKKVALIPDVPNWAFDIAAHIIKNNLADEYKIDIFPSTDEDFDRDLFKILEHLKDYDVIHFFWRAILLDFESQNFRDRVIEKYGNYDEYVRKNIKKISTGVYDHLFENDIEFNKKFTKYCITYVVSSKKLFDIYKNMDGVKEPSCIMGDCFEKSKFFPTELERFDVEHMETLIIGWAGNSTWNKSQKDENGNAIDFKGYNTILKPVVEELKSEGYNIELYCEDKNIRQIPNDEMCEYYSKIHIYTCVSSQEGTPKPLLEAMGCAVPIITTDVGVVNEALEEKQKKFMLGERIIPKNDSEIRKKLKENIIYLYNNRHFLKDLSEESYECSKYYEISNMKNIYKTYFDMLINKLGGYNK